MSRGPALELMGGAAFPEVGIGFLALTIPSYSLVPAVGYGGL